MPHHEGDLRAPEGARFAIIASRWNPRITEQLVAGAREAFRAHGVADDAVDVIRVPGAWELPVTAARLAAASGHAAIVALGCVIRGDTAHFDYVAGEAARGIMNAGLATGVPVIFGVLTVENRAQAEERADPSRMNKGGEAIEAAIEMATLLRGLDAGSEG
jgi:6,7-dimethyl-8-ribityllumazine synthase